MALIRRLPVYAAGIGFTVAIVGLADAREWSGWQTLLAALGVGAFYIVTILVPWLIREDVARLRPASGARSRNGTHVAVTMRIDSDGSLALVPLEDEGPFQVAATSGPIALEHSEPQLTAR